MSSMLCFIVIGVLVGCDQLIKLWAVINLAPVGTMQVIPGLLSLTYVENRGAAFGIFTGQRTLLVLMVTAILGGACWLLLSKKISSKLERLCISLIIAGGLGNLIDRIRLGFVVDYLDINQWFSYPMFNLADCCVVIGACLLVISVLLEEKKKKPQAIAAEEENTHNDNADSSNN